jgi:hypothetical protein
MGEYLDGMIKGISDSMTEIPTLQFKSVHNYFWGQGYVGGYSGYRDITKSKELIRLVAEEYVIEINKKRGII